MMKWENLYEELQQIFSNTKSEELIVVMSDLNAKVGKGRKREIIGLFGLSEMNKRGEKLINFCEVNNMNTTNTWFKKPERRLYTWMSPKHSEVSIIRNQIHYIIINR